VLEDGEVGLRIEKSGPRPCMGCSAKE
jgi:hypothetical protein